MYFVFAIELNLFLPCIGLSVLYSRIYCNTVGDPACRPGILKCGTGTVLYSRGQLGSI